MGATEQYETGNSYQLAVSCLCPLADLADRAIFITTLQLFSYIGKDGPVWMISCLLRVCILELPIQKYAWKLFQVLFLICQNRPMNLVFLHTTKKPTICIVFHVQVLKNHLQQAPSFFFDSPTVSGSEWPREDRSWPEQAVCRGWESCHSK